MANEDSTSHTPRFCSSCGASLPPKSKFCSTCGDKVVESSASPSHQARTKRASGSSSGNLLSEHPVVMVIGAVAALVTIIVFVTGAVSLPALYQRNLQKRIVGSWQEPSGSILTFYDDGTFKESGALLPATGNYHFTDRNHIRIDAAGLFALAGPQVFEVEISNNRLSLTDSFGNTNTMIKFTGNEQVVQQTQEPVHVGGIEVHPIRARMRFRESGWSDLVVDIALVNNSNQWYEINLPRDDFTVTTAEGYTYQFSSDEGYLGEVEAYTYYFLPPGFQVRGASSAKNYTITSRVAQNSTGHRITLPGFFGRSLQEWDQHFIAQPLQIDTTSTSSLDFPLVSNQPPTPIYKVGESVELPEAVFTVTSVQRDGDRLTIGYEFTNLSGGYEIDYFTAHYCIADDGRMYPGDGYMKLSAGPAQTMRGSTSVGIPGQANIAYFVLMYGERSQTFNKIKAFDGIVVKIEL